MNTSRLEQRARLVPLARRMRHEPTDGEMRLWSRLRNRQLGGLKFRRQHPIGGYIVDFACVELMLVVEVDGGQHNEDAGRRSDATRTAALNGAGWKVVRFWADEVMRDTDAVLDSLASAVPSPQPSPVSTRERGQEGLVQ
jgi:very-short-patch-repair endonuclease